MMSPMKNTRHDSICWIFVSSLVLSALTAAAVAMVPDRGPRR
jgi:hypothetical protein